MIALPSKQTEQKRVAYRFKQPVSYEPNLPSGSITAKTSFAQISVANLTMDKAS
jgi:hypothetical protein